ncbi:hypothetical protein ONO12_26915, partial [Salmonella enterica subsp. enterica serovar Montevideo]|nr:hypothetical protein [Salmonella enterica subsp. enterica serovar Montevideo]
QMIVGTHAIFQEQVQFNGLALVIIDEQHRFGVHQRLALWEKGSAGKALLPVKADVVERLKRIFPETGIKEDVNKKDKETLVYLN